MADAPPDDAPSWFKQKWNATPPAPKAAPAKAPKPSTGDAPPADASDWFKQKWNAPPPSRGQRILQGTKEFGQGAAAGPPSTFQHAADALRGFLAEHIPAYKEALTAQDKAWAAATPDQRRTMTPAYFGEAPEIQKAETPPQTIAGQLGFGAEQMGEQAAAAALTPEVEGAGLLRAAARIGQQALTGGLVTGAQTGSKKGAAIGAALGGLGGSVSEVGRVGAPAAAERALPWTDEVSIPERAEASRVAVRPGKGPEKAQWSLLSRKGYQKGFEKLDEEIAGHQTTFDRMVEHPTYNQRPVAANDVLQATKDYSAALRKTAPKEARALDQAAERWANKVGYRETATAAREEPVMGAGGKPLTDARGRPITRTIPGQPAKTTATAAEVRELQNELRAAVPKGQGGAATERFEGAMRRAYADVIPEESKSIGNINRAIESRQTLKSAVDRLVKTNPKWIRQTLLPMALEAGGGALLDRLTGHSGTLDATTIATMAITFASKNPRFATRLMTVLRSGGKYIPAMAQPASAAVTRALDQPKSSQAAPKAAPSSDAPPDDAPSWFKQKWNATPPAPPPQASLPPPAGWKSQWSGIMADVAGKVGVPLDMLHAMGERETGGQKNPATARSPAGAIGLMQIMPDTGRRYGMTPGDLEDPRKNITVAARMLKDLIGQYGLNHKDRILAAYNYGQGNLHRTGFNIADWPQETQNYVKWILGRMRSLAAG